MTEAARPIAVIDIDGVVADVRHRLRHVTTAPKNWDAFFAAATDDPPLEVGVARVRELAVDHDVVYVTGRPERCRADTERWLDDAGIGGFRVIMRRNADRRPAKQTKLYEIRKLAARAAIAIVVDDDAAVCATLSAAGFPVERAEWMTSSEPLRDAQEREGRT